MLHHLEYQSVIDAASSVAKSRLYMHVTAQRCLCWVFLHALAAQHCRVLVKAAAYLHAWQNLSDSLLAHTSAYAMLHRGSWRTHLGVC